MKLGVVTGMRSEAKLFDGLACQVVSGGGHAASTVAKIDSLVADGVTQLVSFGIAGALAPAMEPGELAMATDVAMPDGSAIAADAMWSREVAARIGGARLALIAGASAAVATPEAKAALHRATGAMAIDMESHHVAAAAQRHNLPFIVIRAIADTAGDELPPAALVGLDEEGRPAIGAVLLSLLRNPLQLPALLRVARRSDIALKALLGGRAGLL